MCFRTRFPKDLDSAAAYQCPDWHSLTVQLATVLLRIRHEMDKNQAEVTILREVPAHLSAKKSSGKEGADPLSFRTCLANGAPQSYPHHCLSADRDLTPLPQVVAGVCRGCNGRYFGQEKKL